MRALRNGSKGKDVKKLQTSINRRLKARDAPNRVLKVDGEFGPKTRASMCFAAYLLGIELDPLKHMRVGPITQAEQRFVMNPGQRDAEHLQRARRRLAAHKKRRKEQKEHAAEMGQKRKRVVLEANRAATNYRKQPGAYHYLAGGKANTAYLRPTPRDWRSDCSQFAAAVYKGAGLPSPATPLDHQWASTFSIVKSPHARFVTRAGRKPGDIGMYGSRTAPHHCEVWCGDKFIGHGSPPIDSLTPGEPDYYVTFDFLN